jgi:predicted homoserine dehydrogenase-like protein
MVDNIDVSRAGDCLPMSLAEGCTLRRDIVKDAIIGYTDVELPPGRLCDQLRAEQVEYFSGQGD